MFRKSLAINGNESVPRSILRDGRARARLLRMRPVGIVGKLEPNFKRRLGAAPPLLNLQRLGDATQA